MEFWQSASAAIQSVDYFSRRGMRIEVVSGNERVQTSIEEVGKPYLTPLLDPRMNDFTEANFFWLVCEKDGRAVIVGGGRCDDVGRDAASAIGAMLWRGYGAAAAPRVSSKVNDHLAGRLCYLGDLFSASACGLSRSDVRYFLGVANFLASSHFRANATYSFMRDTDVRRGSADTNGFHSRVWDALSWTEPPDQRSNSEVIVYRNRGDNSDYFTKIKQELASREAG